MRKESFEIRHTKLRNPAKAPILRGMIIEAHNDDMSMGKLTKELTKAGVEIVVVTLTDGAARGLKHYTSEELPDIRWEEGIAAGKLAGASETYRIGLPDGKLIAHQDAAVSFLAGINEKTAAQFMLAPNLADEHPDHAMAHEIALAVAGVEIPVYGMDTITGLDNNGNHMTPDRYIPLSRRTARRENEIYRAHTSQVTNLPPDEKRAMKRVLGMTKRRGQEIGVHHAAVLFDPLNTPRDPLGTILNFKTAA